MIEEDELPLVLVVEDDPDASALVERWLSSDYQVLVLEDAEACFDELERSLPATVCLDLHLPGAGGIEALQRIGKKYPHLPVLILTANRDVETIVEAMQSGAYDYLPKPLDKTKLQTSIRNAVERYKIGLQLARLERETGHHAYAGIIGSSTKMRRLYGQLERVAASDVTVLIQGESGTGKELVAQAIHGQSPRSEGEFVAVNCAAIAENLLESEFFGHERGAFTGAVSQRKGRLEQAHGGSIFLDEVAELDLALQAKLLRALQEKSFHRVGGNVEIKSDFRVIAASHQDLATAAAEGRFREDLYFRLAVFEVDVPPLRERSGDLPILVDHFLQGQVDGRALAISPEAVASMELHNWPGNVRELQNAIERAAVVCEQGRIQASDLPARVRNACATAANPTNRTVALVNAGAPAPQSSPDRLRDMEKRALLDALQQADGNLALAARNLGIGRTTIYRKLKKFNIEVPAR